MTHANYKDNFPWTTKEQYKSPHPAHMDGAPVLHGKQGGCSNAEHNPHESR